MVAVGATVMIILSQCFLHLNIGLFKAKKFFTVAICFYLQEGANERIKELFGVTHFNHLTMCRKDDKIKVKATLFTSTEFSSEELSEIMDSNDFIVSVERYDNQ